MDFSQALQRVKDGGKITRSGWAGVGLHIELQVPDEHSKMTMPYLYLVYGGEEIKRVPWLASQTDLLANDWFALD